MKIACETPTPGGHRSLNLDQLRMLVAIAELGSFSNAAHTLHRARPGAAARCRCLRRQVKRHAQGLMGRVRLGTSTVVVAQLLPPALEWLCARCGLHSGGGSALHAAAMLATTRPSGS